MRNSTKRFDALWNRRNLRWMQDQLSPLAGQPVAYLEIGVYEGLTLCHILDSVLSHPDSWALGLDAWAQPLLTSTETAAVVEERAHANVADYPSGKVMLVRGVSSYVLGALCASLVRFDGNAAHTVVMEWTGGRPAQFDAAFIDGTHAVLDLQIDTSLCWRLMKPGGIIVWDCYKGKIKRALHKFLHTHRYELVGSSQRQLAVRKLAEQ